MNTVKILSALLQFRQATLSAASLDALVVGVVAGLGDEDESLKACWTSWGSLPFDVKEYKRGWKKSHNTGRLPPQMIAKNSRKQPWNLVEKEVERVAGTAALWGRQEPTKTFLKQSERSVSSPELNAARSLNNQRVMTIAARPVPTLETTLFDKIENEI